MNGAPLLLSSAPQRITLLFDISGLAVRTDNTHFVFVRILMKCRSQREREKLPSLIGLYHVKRLSVIYKHTGAGQRRTHLKMPWNLLIFKVSEIYLFVDLF